MENENTAGGSGECVDESANSRMMMPEYLGVKQITAIPMTHGEFSIQERGGPGDNDFSKENVDAEGYLVQYEEGYRTWSPKGVFEAAYRRTNGLSFGLALEAMKRGSKVARKGWNGKGMYLELQVPDANSKMTFPYPYFTIPNCEEGTRIIPYASTIVDIMSEDWCIVE